MNEPQFGILQWVYLFIFNILSAHIIVTSSENTTPVYSQHYNCISLHLMLILDFGGHKLPSYTVDKLIGLFLLQEVLLLTCDVLFHASAPV